MDYYEVDENYSVKMQRNESLIDDIFSAGPNFFPIDEIDTENRKGNKQEISDFKIKMALESFNGLMKIPNKALGNFGKKKINTMINFIKDKQGRIQKYTSTSEYRRKADVIIHTISLTVLCLIFFILGRSPGYLYLYLYVILEIALLTRRFIYYKSQGWHYFMVDF